MSDDKREPEHESAPDDDPGTDSDSAGEDDVVETKADKPLDDDLDRRNPQYIPKGGAFYEHDNRTLDEEPSEEVAEADKKKKMWKEPKSGERWLHDLYVEQEQGPKTAEELEECYGYDIRNEENAPRARRRRRYGRGPEKYERKWDDENAYAQRQPRRPNGRRRAEDFPPLPHQSEGADSRPGPAPVNSTWRSPKQDRGGARGGPVASKSSMSPPPPRAQSPKPSKSRSDDHIKPFRTEANRVHDFPRNPRSVARDVQDVTQSMAAASIHAGPKTKPEPRMKEQMQEPGRSQPMEPPASRQNPKRYSKLRKNFQGYFPPDEVQDLDPREPKPVMDMPQQRAVPPLLPPQRQQDILVPNVNVLPRFPDQFNGNPAFLPARTILQTLPQPGLSPQGPIPPNLSPQLAGIEIQPPPNFVPPPVFMSPEVLNFQSFPTYPPSQNREVYQASSGITYYSPEVQAGSVQPRALPQRRKAAIPIVPPPENQ